MAGSRQCDRDAILKQLKRLDAQNRLPIRAGSREELMRELGVENMTGAQLVKALNSLHRHYGSVIVHRTGTSEHGQSRGWTVRLAGVSRRKGAYTPFMAKQG